MTQPAKLIFMCGKMAAGKSTLAAELARRDGAILLVQDHFLATLYPGDIVEIADYVKYSSRLREALTPHITTLLSNGITVVLDFPANTKSQRAWFRELFKSSKVEHELHFIDVSDELCKRQLTHRSRGLPEGAAFTSEAEFDAITSYFQAPSAEEAFNVIRHTRA
jgi:predicted kinase